ncbi:MAG: hypothetical protein U9Q15_01845 [Patescibacteria group bacterium]|nr:hypothetical protein [Patescibacteria group bacterium]
MGLALFIVYVNIGPKITPEGQKTSDFISGEYWYNGFKEFTSNFGKPNAEKQTYNHISDKNNPGETAQQEENTETKPYNPFDYYQYITYKENEIVFGEERTIQAVIGVPNLGKSDNVRRVLEYIQSQEQQSNDTWIVLMTNKDPADRNFTEIDSWDGYIGTLLFINNIENIEEKIPHNYTKIDIQTYVQWQ